jgi:hypothetical protein
MVKRAFLVAGPQSSGTRMVAGIFVDAGCFGDRTHEQRLDLRPIEFWPDLVVWRRSIPHSAQYPDLCAMTTKMIDAGYDVCLVVTVRERYAMARSQVRWHHAADMARAYEVIEREYRHVFAAAAVHPGPVVVVPYEALALHPESAAQLLEHLGLSPIVPDVFDGDAPYYEVING